MMNPPVSSTSVLCGGYSWNLMNINTIYPGAFTCILSSQALIVSGSGNNYLTDNYAYQYAYRTFDAGSDTTLTVRVAGWSSNGNKIVYSKMGLILTTNLNNPTITTQVSIEYMPFAYNCQLESYTFKTTYVCIPYSPPIWLQIQVLNSQNIINTYYSTNNGSNWTLLTTTNTQYLFLQSYSLGPFVTSTQDGTYIHAAFDQLNYK